MLPRRVVGLPWQVVVMMMVTGVMVTCLFMSGAPHYTEELQKIHVRLQSQENHLSYLMFMQQKNHQHGDDLDTHQMNAEKDNPAQTSLDSLGTSADLDWGDDGTPRNFMLVGSTARSGTSLVGELLALLKPSIYFFEPELFFPSTTHMKVEEKPGMTLIEDVFNCRFSQNFSRWLNSRSTSNVVRHTVTRECKGGRTVCLSPKALSQACLNEHIRVAKVIRVRMGWMRQLLDKPSMSHLKIIHLVRDPRGSLYSMAKYHLHKLDTDYHCPRIHSDLVDTPKLIMEYPKRVLSLVYEDFCLNPIGEATRMWRFLVDQPTAKLPSLWFQYLEKHTHANPEQKHVGVYTTRRESNIQYQAWRTTIPLDVLTTIETGCSAVINSLGYNLFGTLEKARNLTLPLFIK